MGKFWRVDKALEDSEGLGWIRERLGAYDLGPRSTGSACGVAEARSTHFGACARRLRTDAGTGSTAT